MALPTLTASPATLDSEPSTSTSDLGSLSGLQPARVVLRNLDADAGPAGHDRLVQLVVGETFRRRCVKSSEFSKRCSSARLSCVPGLVQDHGADVADVGVDGVAEHEHFHDRHEEREEQRRRVAEDVQHFLARDGDDALEGEVGHGSGGLQDLLPIGGLGSLAGYPLEAFQICDVIQTS